MVRFKRLMGLLGRDILELERVNFLSAFKLFSVIYSVLLDLLIKFISKTFYRT